MTICLITSAIPRTIDLFLGPHMQRLAEQGLTVHIASSGRPSVADEQALTFHSIGFSRSALDLMGHFRAWRDYRRLLDSLTDSGETVLLHLHTPIAAALARLAVRRSHPVKVLYMAHGFHFLPGERNLYYWIERAMARFTDLYVLINDDDVISARAFCGDEPERWVKIPGVGLQRVLDEDARIAGRDEFATRVGQQTTLVPATAPITAPVNDPTADSIASSPPKRVLVVGVLEERKHPELAIEAAALLDENVHLHFCGDGPMEAALRSRVKELGCGHRVHFEGWTEDVLPYFRRADCLLFLSEREGLPMTVAEALAARVAVVAYDIRGVRDLLQGVSGWKIPASRTPRAVADAVDAALATPIDADSYRQQVSLFTLEASLAAHAGAVQRLLQSAIPRQFQVADAAPS